ncbi:hypothetical protein [Rathayibacter sp. VKM Ac-2857]|uniref:hypothetical protein n=1 Tax=Rathayibacter sp. VKM Ac-2857 TaxID=2739020 RepID=UPI0015674D0F|nr:hypothetical protein [Rathayibacter sp. VKM Ac-2857]NQX17317.1 hypothetical protein [Rathayibacter sp. VKM Ac-2857]
MTLLTEHRGVAVERAGRELLLIWRNPSTRRFSKVGVLSVSTDGFRFRYADQARSDPDFFPLDEFPRLEDDYSSSSMPPFFANRIMSPARTSYDDYLGWLALELESPDLPVEILVRTGASRVTDTFHIVEKPSRGARTFVSRFFVSGVRHQPEHPVSVDALTTGERLMLDPDGGNAVNPEAYRVVSRRGVPIGWVPDWLCGEIDELASSGWRFDAIAEKVSPGAPAHVQVLCHVIAHLDG